MEAERGRIALRDRLDVAATGLSERLGALWRSIRTRQAVVPVVSAAVVVVEGMVLGASDLLGSLDPAPARLTATAWPHATLPISPTKVSGGGELRIPGSAQLTLQGVGGAYAQHQGTCTSSGQCTLVAVDGPSQDPVTITVDPSTGAVLAMRT